MLSLWLSLSFYFTFLSLAHYLSQSLSPHPFIIFSFPALNTSPYHPPPLLYLFLCLFLHLSISSSPKSCQTIFPSFFFPFSQNSSIHISVIFPLLSLLLSISAYVPIYLFIISPFPAPSPHIPQSSHHCFLFLLCPSPYLYLFISFHSSVSLFLSSFISSYLSFHFSAMGLFGTVALTLVRRPGLSLCITFSVHK